MKFFFSLKWLPGTFAFLLFTFYLSAQEPTLTWGNEYAEPAGTMATKIIGITSEGFYLLREKARENPGSKPRVWVESYSREMKLLRSEEMELKYKGKQRDFENVLFFGGQLYLLTSFNNAAKKRNYLFKQPLSLKTLLPGKDMDMICETEAPNKEREGTFAFAISKDSTKLLVFNELPYEKKQPERFAFRVFDQNFALVWQKNIILPYPDNQFTVEDYRLDDAGNVYLLGVLYEDEAKWRRRGKPTYKYVVIAYPADGAEPQEYRIDGGEKFITDLTFRIGNDSKLVCAGFFSERGTYSTKGACFFHLDPMTRQLSDRVFSEFPFDFLTAFYSEKEKNKALEAEEKNDLRRSPELYDYSLDELILRSDGGAVLVAEQFYVEQETYRDYPYGYGFYPYGYSPYYSRSNYQTDFYYNYNDLLVVNIRPDGSLEWAARIPKRQETRNDGGYYSSYAMSTVRDKLYFLFNDNARNYDPERKSNRWYNFNGSESVLVLAEVSINGEVSVAPLASNREAGVVTRPKMCKQIGRREMAVFGERGRGYKFASLKFE
ncbi:MAG: hypothetical protein AAB316_04600 [Bacteroidota bacterium]